jgi:hypothetical protein
LKINEEYQRGAEWEPRQMQALLDSLFRNYPIPPLFLNEIKAAGLGGLTAVRYEIVDGQQRIRSLAEYFKGNFQLLDPRDKKLRLPNSLRQLDAPWANKTFSELSADLKAFLESKPVDVFLITSVTNADEIRDLFIRLQSGTALTRQQIRDAWPGNVGPFIERLAGKLKKAPKVLLFGLIDKRGSKVEDEKDRYDSDRQFCAQLLTLFLARERDPLSQQSITAEELDKLYHDNTALPSNGPTAARFEQILVEATEVFKVAIGLSNLKVTAKRKKFKKLDVIATFMLIQDLSRTSNFRFDGNFHGKVAEHVVSDRDLQAAGRSTSGPAIDEYYQKWRSSIVAGLGIRVDPQRLFDDQQKEQIYSRDGGTCQLCGKPTEAADAEYDHFPVPHALGGRTSIENGRLVCTRCHPRGIGVVMRARGTADTPA